MENCTPTIALKWVVFLYSSCTSNRPTNTISRTILFMDTRPRRTINTCLSRYNTWYRNTNKTNNLLNVVIYINTPNSVQMPQYVMTKTCLFPLKFSTLFVSWCLLIRRMSKLRFKRSLRVREREKVQRIIECSGSRWHYLSHTVQILIWQIQQMEKNTIDYFAIIIVYFSVLYVSSSSFFHFNSRNVTNALFCIKIFLLCLFHWTIYNSI